MLLLLHLLAFSFAKCEQEGTGPDSPYIPLGYYLRWYGGSNITYFNWTDTYAIPNKVYSPILCPSINGVYGTLLCSPEYPNSTIIDLRGIPQPLVRGIVDCPFVSPPSLNVSTGALDCLIYVDAPQINGELCSKESGDPYCLYYNITDQFDEFKGYVGSKARSSELNLYLAPIKTPTKQDLCPEIIEYSPPDGPKKSLKLTKALCVNEIATECLECTNIGDLLLYYHLPEGLQSLFVDGQAGLWYESTVTSKKKNWQGCVKEHGSDYGLRCYYQVPQKNIPQFLDANYYDYSYGHNNITGE